MDVTALWRDLCGLFCDIPQALRNTQPGLTSDLADARCCDDSIALAGTVGTWKQWIIYCARTVHSLQRGATPLPSGARATA